MVVRVVAAVGNVVIDAVAVGVAAVADGVAVGIEVGVGGVAGAHWVAAALMLVGPMLAAVPAPFR